MTPPAIFVDGPTGATDPPVDAICGANGPSGPADGLDWAGKPRTSEPITPPTNALRTPAEAAAREEAFAQELAAHRQEAAADLQEMEKELRRIMEVGRKMGRQEALAQMPKPPRKERTYTAKASGRAPIEALPLFAPDSLIGEALLGRDRVQEWKQLVPLLEARGLPKVDQTMGGRFVPAVRAFFDHQYGLGASTPLAPDGVEDFDAWKRTKPKRPA